MNKKPTYIPIILSSCIRLKYVTNDILKKLKKQKLDVVIDNDYYCIKYDDTTKDHFKNINLIETLMKLNDMGILFGEDFKQYFSPAEFMRELQREYILRKSFKSIGFNVEKKGDWMIQDNTSEIFGEK